MPNESIVAKTVQHFRITHSRNIRKVVIASMITAVTLAYLNEIGLPYFMVAPLPSDFWLTPALLLNIIGGIPAILALRYFKVPYATTMTIFAIIEAYWLMPHLQLILLPEYSSDPSWEIFAYASSYLIFLAAYLLTYLLFNLWTTNYKYKLAAAGTILIATYFATRPSY